VGADHINGQGGNDVLAGGAGDDVISGGVGVDQLSGGADADLFIFLKPDTGKTLATADTILDFDTGSGDIVDLSGIDANSANGTGDDVFSFVGTAAFSKVAGELRYEVSGADVVVSGDLNGDGKADLMIHLTNVASLAASDFVL